MKKISRTPKSWLAYLLLSLYVYCLNAAGPVTSYLRSEFGLSYTLSSVHTSAFALGIVLTGLLGGLFLRLMSPWRSMALGAIGVGVGGIVLSLARRPAISVLGLFLMGLVGTLILAVYPAILNKEMGEGSAVGISEANTSASVFASLAPVAIGFFGGLAITWRPAVLIVTLASMGLGVWLLLKTREKESTKSETTTQQPIQGKLPSLFWVLWIALVLSVSIEFCTIYWSGDLIRHKLAFPQAQATQAVSLFLVGMVVGRFTGGKLMQTMAAKQLLIVAILVGMAGFGLFWGAGVPWLSLAGLCLMGLGVANLYPVILAMAVQWASPLEALAGSRCTLASGTAILVLPFVLGALADGLGITRAFLIVAALYLALIAMLAYAARSRNRMAAGKVESNPGS